MHVRFSAHAIQRLRQRFSGMVGELLPLIERALFEGVAQPDGPRHAKAEGMIRRRRARVILALDQAETVTVVTAMWVRRG